MKLYAEMPEQLRALSPEVRREIANRPEVRAAAKAYWEVYRAGKDLPLPLWLRDHTAAASALWAVWLTAIAARTAAVWAAVYPQPVTDDRPNWARDRLKGAAGD